MLESLFNKKGFETERFFLIKKAQGPAPFLKRDSNTGFSCEISEILNNTYFEGHLRPTTSEKSATLS